MKIVFCGTPDYAVPSLKKLHALAPAHELVAVVSQPDKPKGRSKIPTPPPVVEAALKLGIPRERVFQPRSINRTDVLNALRALQPDILCVIAYGNILKADALALGKHFPINAHASLLPKYRGAAPIQAAILAGDSQTGVCIIKMEAGLDTGPVLLRRAISIDPRDTAGTLHDKLAELSADCFAEALDRISRNDFTLEPQDDASASYAGKIEKSSGSIDWRKPAIEIERHVRAMTPWPGAWTMLTSPAQQQRLRLASVTIADAPRAVAGAGSYEESAQRLIAACGDERALQILSVQPEGKREMSAAEFMRGSGRVFGTAFGWRNIS